MKLKKYKPHEGQIAFHYALDHVYRFVAMICGIRGGKTYAGAREAVKRAWNSKAPENVRFGIVAPTFHMLDRTTWREFRYAAKALIADDNDTKKVITLKNGREVHGFSAEKPDKVRNVTLCGGWVDEARECKDFSRLWDVLLGRVLSTGGKLFVTTSPNSFDDVHDVFIENKKEGYGTVRFATYENKHITKEAIEELASIYDEKTMQQELLGEFVIFEGAVYYTFNRKDNAGQLALKVARYNPAKPINLCCDFNVDPMAFILTQYGEIEKKSKHPITGIEKTTKLKTVNAVDEIYLKNSNTIQCCEEFKNRYPYHKTGLYLYGDATGKARHTSSNITNWEIMETELAKYEPVMCVPTVNPAERDRINAVNGLICNSKGDRRVQVNPEKCKHLIRDFEQVSYKEGSTQIDKTKDMSLTHSSDGFGYMIDKEFGLGKGKIEGYPI